MLHIGISHIHKYYLLISNTNELRIDNICIYEWMNEQMSGWMYIIHNNI